jgi:hypothetical protein
VLRRIFGPKREEVAGGSRTLHLRSFIIFNRHQIFLGRMRWEGLIGTYVGGEKSIKSFSHKTRRERPLG